MKYGSVHGRFQPLHLGHLYDYIIPALKKCDHLIIGISNSDPSHILPDESNISRSLSCNNPLNYFERMKIIEDSLVWTGINKDDFTVTPFPVNYPQQIKFYITENTTNYLTIFDQWGEKKLTNLKHLSLKTSVLYKKDISEKLISSTMVRERIMKNESIDNLVPQPVVDYMISCGLKKRLLELKMMSK